MTSRPMVHKHPDDEAGHRGEVQFANQLVALADGSCHVWFGVDYLPGVTDLDILLCHEEIGFFAIEVKAIPIDAILAYSATHMTVSGRSSTTNPLKQAQRAKLKLIEFLRSVRVSPPFIHTTAAFPRITRRSFVQRFGGTHAVRRQAEGIIFAEDLTSWDALTARLSRILTSPAYGAPPASPRAPFGQEIQALIGALDPEGRPAPSRADLERSNVLRQPITRTSRRQIRLSNYIKPADRAPTIFRGYPGTGKTYYLLRIAIEHARSGRSVLFLCFNRVLASDIRRMLATTGMPKEVASRIDVVHAWGLRGRYSNAYVDGDEGALAELPMLFERQTPLEEYGTICVDEAQDLPEWVFRLVNWHAERGAEWFLADGPGQELYGTERAPAMIEMTRQAEERGKVEKLRTVFRTAHVDFLVAQGVYRQAPHLTGVSRWVAEHPLPKVQSMPSGSQPTLFDEDLDVDFDGQGSLPEIVEIPRWSETLAASDRELRRGWIQQVLTRELSMAASAGRPGDVAVLFRHVKRKDDAEDVKAALDRLQTPYVDQIDDSNRDLLLPNGHVRLVSFKSARGIEAHRTILLGFDDLGGRTPDILRDSRNQAYIALSRAKASTTIVTRPHKRGPISAFLVEMVDTYAASRPPSATPNVDHSQPQAPDQAWSQGVVDRVVEGRGFGFIRASDGREVFFHRSALLGLELEGATGQSIHFTEVRAERGSQATVVALEPLAGRSLDAQPGFAAGFVCVAIGDRGFGFLLLPSLAKRVLFHVNRVAGQSTELAVGARVDVLVEDSQQDKPRASLVVRRT